MLYGYSIGDPSLHGRWFYYDPAGCGTFLLTGSQVVNRFIGSNVSANSGREQLMSLMSYGHALSTATHIGGNAISGATSFGLGVGASALGRVGGNKLVNSIGGAIQKFGNNIKSNNSIIIFIPI